MFFIVLNYIAELFLFDIFLFSHSNNNKNLAKSNLTFYFSFNIKNILLCKL